MVRAEKDWAVQKLFETCVMDVSYASPLTSSFSLSGG